MSQSCNVPVQGHCQRCRTVQGIPDRSSDKARHGCNYCQPLRGVYEAISATSPGLFQSDTYGLEGSTITCDYMLLWVVGLLELVGNIGEFASQANVARSLRQPTHLAMHHTGPCCCCVEANCITYGHLLLLMKWAHVSA
jgi:hypothetical protein